MNRASSVTNFILRKMYEVLDQRGWCQFVMCKNKDGEPCFLEDRDIWSVNLVGAYYWVRSVYPATARYGEQALLAIIRALNRRNSAEGLVKSPNDIIKDRALKSDEWKFHFNKFNDASGRTKMEVLRLLKEAADDD